MELKQYISQVINEIADAIKDINDGDPINNTIVNPSLSDFMETKNSNYCITERSDVSGSAKTYLKIVDVDFDVILSSSSKSEAGGKINVLFGNLGGTGGSTNEMSNHIHFTLPVLFPSIKQPYDISQND